MCTRAITAALYQSIFHVNHQVYIHTYDLEHNVIEANHKKKNVYFFVTRSLIKLKNRSSRAAAAASRSISRF